MNLDDVAMFVRVVEAGGYAAAARSRGLPKSSLSRRITKLELSLGVPLLARNTRHLRLTETGSQLYERFREVVADLDSAEMELAAAGERARAPNLQGLLRLTATGAFGRLYIAPLTGEFLGLHPGVRIELSLLERRINLIEEGFDLAIRMGDLDDAVGLVTRRLGAAERLLCASPSYMARMSEALERPSDLRSHGLLTSASGQNSWVFSGPDGQETFTPAASQIRLTANNLEVLHAAALSGVGLAILPRYMVRGDLEAGHLVVPLVNHRVQPIDVSAVWPASRLAQPKTRAFIDFLAARLSAAEAWVVSPHDECVLRLHSGRH